jgi:membrane protease YdiL (CAAX protease family)
MIPDAGQRPGGFEEPAGEARRPSVAERAMALLEVLICSDYPTQIGLGATLAVLGYGPIHNGGVLTIGYVMALSLIDTALLIALIVVFLRVHGETPRELLLGRRPVLREALAGLPLIVGAFAVALIVLLTVQTLAPWLHNVENPLQNLIGTGRDAALFAIVIVVAGGVREEIQRAFLLSRFERWLGGPQVGLVVASVAFGFGHATQGWDAAIATGALGLFWGIVYLRRRSIVAPLVSHSGFNLLQLGQFLLIGR